MLTIGLAGKKQSGKSLLGRFLCVQYDAVYAPLAAGLKGSCLHTVGLLSFKPQWHEQARKALQQAGTDVGRNIDENLWIKAWTATFGGFERVIIPDVRFPNELDFIHQRGGVTIYLHNPTNEQTDTHPSETSVMPDDCDIVIEVTDPYTQRQKLFRDTLNELKRWKLKPQPRKPVIYVGSNISFAEDFEVTFETLAALLADQGFDPITPIDVGSPSHWTTFLSVHTFRNASVNLVATDLLAVAGADGGLFYLETPSIGAACEILSLSIADKPVAIVTPLTLLYHPWLHAFGTVFWNSVTDAIQWLKSMLTVLD